MIENAWNAYRGWAKRSRRLQAASRRMNRLALASAVLAAILGAAATQAPAEAWWGKLLSALAAIAAGITPLLGKEILEVRHEAGWVRARGAAEAVKSECYRYAAGAGTYATRERDAAFRARIDEIEAAALPDVTPLQDPVAQDPRRPAAGVARDWYLDHRLREQQGYYARGQGEYERMAGRLRALLLATSVVAVVLGASGAAFSVTAFAPWVGVLTTIGATIAAYGFMERYKFLAATYGAMVVRLGHLVDRTDWDLPTLVTSTEDLLVGEQRAWSDHMMQMIAVPAAPKQP